MSVDKAGRRYWDELWTAERTAATRLLPQPASTGYRGRFHRFFSEVFTNVETNKSKLLEAGCGGSSWLPYFAREFGFEVSGIDYSPIGCAQARTSLSRLNLPGDIVCADFFMPPEGMRNVFDVVFSSGVVEHFTNTTECLMTLSEFLKPGGLMITSIPNMHGLCGFLQKRLNRPVFDIHVPLDAGELASAHEQAGLEVLSCDYFMSTNFGVLNLNGVAKQSLAGLLKKMALNGLMFLSYSFWIIEYLIGPLKANSITSPYINCVARKTTNHPN